MATIAAGTWVKARWFNAEYSLQKTLEYPSVTGRFEERCGIVTRIYRDNRSMEQLVVLHCEDSSESTVSLHHVIEVRSG